jgi:MFS family permease
VPLAAPFLPPALTVPRFRLYAVGHAVSMIGGWIQFVALGVLIYRLTGSVFLLGVTGFLLQIPFLLLGPFTGAIVDRLPRLRLLIAIETALAIIAFAMAACAFASVTSVVPYLVLAVLTGAANALEMPARQALIMAIVGDRQLLPSAVAISATTFNAGRMIGPAIAGIALVYLPEAWCFVANGLSYFAIIAALVAMKLPADSGARAPTGGTSQGLLDGLRHLAHFPAMRYLLPQVALVGMLGTPYVQLMPGIAREFFAADAGTAAALLSAAGLGALLAALTLSMQRGTRMHARAVALAPLAVGVALLAFALSRTFTLSLGLMMLVGGAIVMTANATNILVQNSVPDHWRGRAIGLYAMAFQGMTPIGHFAAGALAARIGIGATLALNALLIIVVALATRWRLAADPVGRTELERGHTG